MSKPNIVFLDFDGPICNHRASLSVQEDKWGSGMDYLDPIALGLVKRICEEHNAKIVISSSWRTDYNLLGFQTILGAACPGLGKFVYNDQHHFRTVSWVFSEEQRIYVSDRGVEIQQWLLDNEGEWNNFVVIDDMADMRPVQDHLVKVDCYEGFGFHAYMQAKKILSGIDFFGHIEAQYE